MGFQILVASHQKWLQPPKTLALTCIKKVLKWFRPSPRWVSLSPNWVCACLVFVKPLKSQPDLASFGDHIQPWPRSSPFRKLTAGAGNGIVAVDDGGDWGE